MRLHLGSLTLVFDSGLNHVAFPCFVFREAVHSCTDLYLGQQPSRGCYCREQRRRGRDSAAVRKQRTSFLDSRCSRWRCVVWTVFCGRRSQLGGVVQTKQSGGSPAPISGGAGHLENIIRIIKAAFPYREGFCVFILTKKMLKYP